MQTKQTNKYSLRLQKNYEELLNTHALTHKHTPMNKKNPYQENQCVCKCKLSAHIDLWCVVAGSESMKRRRISPLKISFLNLARSRFGIWLWSNVRYTYHVYILGVRVCLGCLMGGSYYGWWSGRTSNQAWRTMLCCVSGGKTVPMSDSESKR